MSQQLIRALLTDSSTFNRQMVERYLTQLLRVK